MIDYSSLEKYEKQSLNELKIQKRDKVSLMTLYAIRSHDRETEDDPILATIMYSINGEQGPWFDMVSGYPDHCYEILDALTYYGELQDLKKEEEIKRYQEEIKRYQKDISSETEESIGPAHTLDAFYALDELKNKIPTSVLKDVIKVFLSEISEEDE